MLRLVPDLADRKEAVEALEDFVHLLTVAERFDAFHGKGAWLQSTAPCQPESNVDGETHPWKPLGALCRLPLMENKR